MNYWSENLKEKYVSEVNFLLGLLENYYNFKKAASSVDSILQYQLLIAFDQLNYPYYIGSAYGILNNYDIEKLKTWQQYPFLSDDRIQVIRDILNSEAIDDIAFEYTRIRSEFLATAEGLETEIFIR